jgi:hypothetical protein
MPITLHFCHLTFVYTMKQLWEKCENSTFCSCKLGVLFNPLDEYVILSVLAFDQISNVFDIRQAVFAI